MFGFLDFAGAVVMALTNDPGLITNALFADMLKISVSSCTYCHVLTVHKCSWISALTDVGVQRSFGAFIHPMPLH